VGKGLLRSATLAAGLSGLLSVPAWGEVIEVGPSGVTRTNRQASVTASGSPAGAGSSRMDTATLLRRDKARPVIEAASRANNLSDRLLEAVAYAESRFNPAALSPAGAVGLMQLMPATAREMGLDPAHAAENAHGGGLYLRRMLDRYDGDLIRALSAYNAGPGAVDRHGGAPPYAETKAYVGAVLDYLTAGLEEDDAG